MQPRIGDQVLAGVAGAVLVIGLVDALLGGVWDLLAVLALALVPVGWLLVRLRSPRPDTTLRIDLHRWVAEHAARTGQRPEVVVDRSVAAYRRSVDPLGGHRAAVGERRGGREPSSDGDDDSGDAPEEDEETVTVRLRGEGLKPDLVGGKAAALDRLIRAGLPVPGAGVITTAAYRQVAALPPIADLLEELAGADLPEPSDADAERTRIDEVFLAVPLPDDLTAAILELGRQVDTGAGLAVRSSATAEDAVTASFAGQYRSLLGITEPEDLLAAVRLVWASLWHPGVRAYRAHRSVDEDDLAMAVVVMRMADADHAGVVFTIDPGGRRDHARLEVVEGLAEGLVDGSRTPEAHVLPRSGPAPLPDHPAPLDQVLSLALRTEELAGRPQDVEWAHDGQRVWLVQARPITTGTTGSGDDDGFDTPPVPGATYTSEGVGEMLPGVVPPLLWSIDAPLLEQGFRQMFDDLGVLPEDLPAGFAVLGRFRGRAALNLSALKAAAGQMPGGSGAELERQYFGEVLSAHENGESDATGALARLRALPAMLRALRMRARLRTEGEIVIRTVEQLVTLGIDPAELDDAHLLAYWRRIAGLAGRVVATQAGVAAAAAASYRGLEQFLEQHVPEDQAARWAQRLTTGGTEPCGVRTSLQVCDLVLEGLDQPAVREVLEAGMEDPGSLREGLRGDSAGRAFLQRFHHLLARAGSASMFAGPTWDEDEEVAWTLLHQAVRTELAGDRPRGGERRETVLAELSDQLTGGWRWTVQRILTGQVIDLRLRLLRRLTDDAATFLRLRERTKLAVLRLGGEARRTIRAAAARLVERGALEVVGDVDHLDIVELEAALAGAPLRPAVIARRRRASTVARDHDPLPRTFEGRPGGAGEAAAAADGELVGWAASPGRHTGRVRVVTDLASAELEQGDVLVAQATDPSWTPLFLRAGAVVVEQGGPLSHAAIVARELGLPAVLNLPGATRTLTTGAVVTVDGDRGRVRLHEPPEGTEDAVDAGPTGGSGSEVQV